MKGHVSMQELCPVNGQQQEENNQEAVKRLSVCAVYLYGFNPHFYWKP